MWAPAGSPLMVVGCQAQPGAHRGPGRFACGPRAARRRSGRGRGRRRRSRTRRCLPSSAGTRDPRSATSSASRHSTVRFTSRAGGRPAESGAAVTHAASQPRRHGRAATAAPDSAERSPRTAPAPSRSAGHGALAAGEMHVPDDASSRSSSTVPAHRPRRARRWCADADTPKVRHIGPTPDQPLQLTSRGIPLCEREFLVAPSWDA